MEKVDRKSDTIINHNQLHGSEQEEIASLQTKKHVTLNKKTVYFMLDCPKLQEWKIKDLYFRKERKKKKWLGTLFDTENLEEKKLHDSGKWREKELKRPTEKI